MIKKRNLERLLYSCPEVDCYDFAAFPQVSDDNFMVMEQEFCEDTSFVRIFPFVRETEDGKGYIDLYVWDLMLYPESYRGFVICDGYSLSEAEEVSFLEYINVDFICFSDEQIHKFNEKIVRRFPSWHYFDYSSEYMRDALKHMYFASHRSGAREILYKADLCRIAANLDEIPSYNMIGSNPESIIGYDLPLKLLRLLNQPDMISKLFAEESIIQCRNVYSEYSGYIGKELPSGGQWNYLEALYNNGGTFAGHGFIRALYEKLSLTGTTCFLDEYEQFLKLRDEISDIKKMRIPKPCDVWGVVEKLEKVRECRTENERVDPLFSERKKRNGFEYKGRRYAVSMPGSSLDICKEAIAQGNCVMDYIEDHASGDTTILFVRRVNEPEQSFVTMEVKDRVIEQVYGRFNSLPKKEVYEFLKEYARARWLLCDPYKLITRGMDDDEFDCDEELWEYAEEFRKKHYPAMEEYVEEQSYTQMTFEEIFPEIFIRM